MSSETKLSEFKKVLQLKGQEGPVKLYKVPFSMLATFFNKTMKVHDDTFVGPVFNRQESGKFS